MTTHQKDLFSHQASAYSHFRPSYPRELFEFLESQVSQKNLAWDCGTGNGQAAVELSKGFKNVIATDLSEKQISQAPKRTNIEYRVAPAENTNLPSGTVNLTTVAQAFHWFNHQDFLKEVRRVSKPDGYLAVWCYQLAQVNPECDELVLDFYNRTLDGCWEDERRHVDDGYKNISVSLQSVPTPEFKMVQRWTVDHYLGYLGTWSGLHKYMRVHGQNPLDALGEKIRKAWGPDQKRDVTWPLILRLWHTNSR